MPALVAEVNNIGVTNIIADSVLALDTWYNLIFSINKSSADSCRIYINGDSALVYTIRTVKDTTHYNVGAFSMGAINTASPGYASMNILNFAIWNETTCDSTQAADMYNAGTPISLNDWSGSMGAPTWNFDFRVNQGQVVKDRILGKELTLGTLNTIETIDPQWVREKP